MSAKKISIMKSKEVDRDLAMGRLYAIGYKLENNDQYIYKHEDPPKLEYIPSHIESKKVENLSYEQKGHLQFEFVGGNEIKVIYRFPELDGYPEWIHKEYKINYNDLDVNNEKSISIRDDFIKSMQFWENRKESLTLSDRAYIKDCIERQFNLFQRLLAESMLSLEEFNQHYIECMEAEIYRFETYYAVDYYDITNGLDRVFKPESEALRQEIQEIVKQEFERLRDTLDLPSD